MDAADYLSVKPDIISTDIVLFDLVDYSLLSTTEQYLSVCLLNIHLPQISNMLGTQKIMGDEKLLLGFIPTGDGFYVILNPVVKGYGPIFALSVRNLTLHEMEKYPVFRGMKAAVHFGQVVHLGSEWPNTEPMMNTFVGEGLNDCSRLLSDCVLNKAKNFYKSRDASYVVVSDTAWRQFENKYSINSSRLIKLSKGIQFRAGRPFEIDAKHNKKFRVRLVDYKGDIGFAPPSWRSLKSGI